MDWIQLDNLVDAGEGGALVCVSMLSSCCRVTRSACLSCPSTTTTASSISSSELLLLLLSEPTGYVDVFSCKKY